MANLTWQPIKSIKIGDKVVGVDEYPHGSYRHFCESLVLSKSSRIAPVQKIITDKGSFESTKEHPWLKGPNWSRCENLRSGTKSRLMHWVSQPVDVFPEDSDYVLGYLAGAIRGDGSIRHYNYSGRRRHVDTQHRFRFAVKDKEFLDVVQRCLKKIGCETYIGSVNCGIIKRAVQTFKKEAVEKIEALVERGANTETYKRGFLGGIFDAEGSFVHASCLRIFNYDGKFLRKIGSYLKDFNFNFRREEKAIRLLGGLPEIIRFFSLTRPKIQRKKMGVFGLALKQRGGEIQDIVSVGKKRVFNLETSTRTFIANGFASHNCYARFMVKYHRRGEEWGEFVDAKVNSPKVLSKHLSKAKVGSVLLSSVTDPYQPIEEKYELTRKILENLLMHDFPVSILTKSSLVLRDIDLLRRFNNCEVGLTITTLSDDVKKCFEPFSSNIEERLNALQVLHHGGIRTFVFLGPLLPFLVEDSLEGLAHKFEEVGVSGVLVDRLNIKYGNWKTIRESLEKCYPKLLHKYERILFSGNDYFEELKKKVAKHLGEKGLNFNFCY